MLEDLSHLSLHLSDDALLDLFNQYNGELCGAPHMVQDYLNAFEHFCKIARKENDFGYEFYALGKMYELGRGVAQDTEKAKGLYTEAIKHYQTYEDGAPENKHTQAIQDLEQWL
ncbi:hypothetical protein NHP21005_16280 [Helicobacter sp. NHP21005]|uniref:hypothetical protein n=1 Tax=Helicobacter felistomachi TaxID=3040201 RepID=UPI0025724138|nr:hypothetical protein [Helicobacter sp. NHP21005]BEG57940.1 hypothetical protein NHP21005_16280 [Helicobacter sp. NHP21005]